MRFPCPTVNRYTHVWYDVAFNVIEMVCWLTKGPQEACLVKIKLSAVVPSKREMKIVVFSVRVAAQPRSVRC